MKVSELIKTLRKIDPDLEVAIWCEELEGCLTNPTVSVKRLYHDTIVDAYFEEPDGDDEKPITIVCLDTPRV